MSLLHYETSFQVSTFSLEGRLVRHNIFIAYSTNNICCQDAGVAMANFSSIMKSAGNGVRNMVH